MYMNKTPCLIFIWLFVKHFFTYLYFVIEDICKHIINISWINCCLTVNSIQLFIFKIFHILLFYFHYFVIKNIKKQYFIHVIYNLHYECCLWWKCTNSQHALAVFVASQLTIIFFMTVPYPMSLGTLIQIRRIPHSSELVQIYLLWRTTKNMRIIIYFIYINHW